MTGPDRSLPVLAQAAECKTGTEDWDQTGIGPGLPVVLIGLVPVPIPVLGRS